MTIGVVHSDYHDLADTPVQSRLNPDAAGYVDLHPIYADALDGLAEFDYAWLLTWLDRVASAATPPMRQIPFLLQRTPRLIGMFAMRGPHRLNPIGLSLVRVLGIDGSRLYFAGVDVVDGTPLLDIKPYVAQLDAPPGTVKSGWFDTVHLPTAATPRSLTIDDPAPDPDQ